MTKLCCYPESLAVVTQEEAGLGAEVFQVPQGFPVITNM